MTQGNPSGPRQAASDPTQPPGKGPPWLFPGYRPSGGKEGGEEEGSQAEQEVVSPCLSRVNRKGLPPQRPRTFNLRKVSKTGKNAVTYCGQ